MMSFSLAALPLLFFTSLLPLQESDLPSAQQIDSWMRAKRWDQVEVALEKLAAAGQANGNAWYQLASARHKQKDWKRAIEAGYRAAESPELRANALYNIACAQSMDGQLEAAMASLADCRAAGFLDFDLMSSDADLVALGKRREVSMPKSYPFTELLARNKVKLKYALLKPAGYDPAKTYPVLVALAPGGVRSADWMMEELWSGMQAQKDWLVLCIAAPDKQGWWTHPTHHALEELLKKIQTDLHVEGGNFHLFAFGNGSAPALTYSGMSKKFFRSLTLVSCTAWDPSDEGSWSRYKELPVLQLVGSEASVLEFVQAAHARLKREGCDAKLVVVPDDWDMLESLRGEKLLAAISAAHRRGAH